MAWEAIHCDRQIGAPAITEAIGEVLAVDTAYISVADRIENARTDARIMVAMRQCPGNFRLAVDIITGDDEISARLNPEALRSMIVKWNCRGMVSDSGNPYVMTLLQPGGEDEHVYVDAERFDTQGELAILGPATDRPPASDNAPSSERRTTSVPPKGNRRP